MPEENTPQNDQETPEVVPATEENTPVENTTSESVTPDTGAPELKPENEASVPESKPETDTPADAEQTAEAVTEGSVETPVTPPEAESAEGESNDTPETETPEAKAETPAPEEASETPVSEEKPVEENKQDTSSGETPAEEIAAEAANEETAEEESAGFELADAGEGIKNTLLAEIMGSDEEFRATLNNSNPLELTLLMENIAIQDSIDGLIFQGGEIRKQFRKLTEGEEAVEEDEGVVSRFHTAFAKFNKKRKEYFEQLEVTKTENSAKKFALLEKLKEIVEAEKVAAINEVREIQKEWKEIGWVLQKDIATLGKTYKHYLDIFYTLRGHYNQLRDQDRQYNLEDKLRLIEEIEEIIPEDENIGRDKWNDLTSKLQNLQEIWRTTGHVPRENAEEVISRYRSALDRFFETRSSFYASQDQQREANAEQKQALIDKLQPYAEYKSDRAKEWNKKTKEILAVQEEWKKIGPAPKEQNKELWKTYREICDKFFNAKGQFFKAFDDVRQKNLDLKTAICEQAEALSESQEWNETAEKLKALQKEWKEIGPVQDRYSNKVWKRFRKACDKFFEARGKALGTGKESQKDNLKSKEEILDKIKAIIAQDAISNEDAETFKDLQVEWKTTGHVPFKEKDRINGAFRELANQFYDKLDATNSESRRLRFEARVGSQKGRGGSRGGSNSAFGSIQRQIRDAESKIDSYETNILYIAKGKKGDALRKQIQGQIDAEKKQVKDLKAQLKKLREEEQAAKEGPKKEEKKSSKKKAEKKEVPAAETPETKSDDSASKDQPASEEASPKAEPVAVAEGAETETPAAESEAPESVDAPAEETAKSGDEAPASEESTSEEDKPEA